MTIQMNIAEAKARLSELVARAEAGEEVIIARGGKPIVTLASRAGGRDTTPRPLGMWDRYGAAIPEDLFLGPDPETDAALMDWEAASIGPTE